VLIKPCPTGQKLIRSMKKKESKVSQEVTAACFYVIAQVLECISASMNFLSGLYKYLLMNFSLKKDKIMLYLMDP
jgi:hypothetical protein